MNFDDVTAEARERFVEAGLIINHLAEQEAEEDAKKSVAFMALKGHALVSIYGAVERGVNSTVEAALDTITGQGVASSRCSPNVLSIFHYPQIQSVRSCGAENTIEKASDLLFQVKANEPMLRRVNPFSDRLKNVDGSSMIFVAQRFGVAGYEIELGVLGRLNNLRERRNAVAHGREAASEVGSRFKVTDLRSMLNKADGEIFRFIEVMRRHCEGKAFLIGAA